MKLKLNPNEPYRIRVKCTNEEGCPFDLFMSEEKMQISTNVRWKTIDPCEL